MKILFTLLLFVIPLRVSAYEITTPGNNLGIGTTAPGTALGVNGTARANVYITADGVSTSSSDNSAAIQAAINSLSSGTVILPAGTLNSLSVINLKSNVCLKGQGRTSTIISGGSNNIFDTNGTSSACLEDLQITGTSGLGLYTGSMISNFKMRNVYFHVITNYGWEIDSTVVSFNGTNVKFDYITNAAVYLTSNAVITNFLWLHPDFEESYAEDYKAIGNVSSHGDAIFINPIFESSHGQYAVDLGANANGYTFLSGHFENNGIGQTTAYDIHCGTSCNSINLYSNQFSMLANGVTTGSSIYSTDSASQFSLQNNYYADHNAGYTPTSFAAGTKITQTGDKWYQTIQPSILNSGNIGIGSFTPGQILDVQGTIRSTALSIGIGTTNQARLCITSTNNVIACN